MKKVLSIILIISIIIPFSIFGTTSAFAYGGGTTIKWSLDDKTGNLVISGNGDMPDLTSGAVAEYGGWVNGISIARYIKTVYVEEGITRVGNYSFSAGSSQNKALNLETAYIASTVKSVGNNAFMLPNINTIYFYAENVSFGTGAIPAFTTIYGYKGSSVEKYAKENGNEFISMCRTHTEQLVNVQEATCNNKGYSGDKVCSVCGMEIEKGHEISALGHDFQVVGYIAPTCTQTGYSGNYSCTRCGVTQKYGSAIEASGHSFGDWQINSPSSCVKEGLKIRFCKNCDVYETSIIPIINHIIVNDEEVLPTCDTEGKTRGSHCSLCEQVIEKQTVIPAKGHSYICDVIVPGTTSLGYTVYSCSVCGDSYKDNFISPTAAIGTFKCTARTVKAQTVTWNNVKTASGFQVQISTKDGKKWSTYATLGAGVTKYTFKDLAAGNNYKFRVRYFIKAEDGKNYYSPWSKTLNSPTLPGATSLTKVTAGSKSFAAQWKKQAVTGYQIEYSTNAKFTGSKKVTIKKAGTLKTTVKKLTAKKVYYVRVRTYKTISGANYFSTWSKAVKVKTK